VSQKSNSKKKRKKLKRFIWWLILTDKSVALRK
jgi:hypothetical protein